MKYGEFLKENLVSEWKEFYMDYDALKTIIKELEVKNLSAISENAGTSKKVSISVAPPTNKLAQPIRNITEHTQESFFVALDQEIEKIKQFTKKQVGEIRAVLRSVESEIESQSFKNNETVTERLKADLERAGESFLKLEKYVNLNFTGFHKILKKHDRRLPNPCRGFYLSRLHEQSWVRGDYSDIIVSMSRAYSSLRGDEEGMSEDTSKQNFVRSTRKYWVRTEHISTVKYLILQHLPVFLQKTMEGECDSQLVNSVYLDNDSMELYHGRLDKTPGAIALRMRWYGTGTPETVFVERKTHRESWMGEVSVKERFIVPEVQVLPLLQGKFNIEKELEKKTEKLKKAGKWGTKEAEEDVNEWLALVREVSQAINSKLLIPTMRTQYMRTAFQVPFDATVRISIDTNLCMVTERVSDLLSPSSLSASAASAVSSGASYAANLTNPSQLARWFRDPHTPVPETEITRFPHAVLEIKLQLKDESQTPLWVTELLESGMVQEVHKFSKFIHGCAVLMPEEVRAFPYWIDDPSISQSIAESGAEDIIQASTPRRNPYHNTIPAFNKSKKSSDSGEAGEGQQAETVSYQQGGAIGRSDGGRFIPLSRPRGFISDLCQEEEGWECTPMGGEKCELFGAQGEGECCEWAGTATIAHVTQQKVEPKVHFANERTFLHWLHSAAVLASIGTGILAFSPAHPASSAGSLNQSPSNPIGPSSAQYFGLLLLPISLLFIGYSVRTYHWRSKLIRDRDVNRWDDPLGPVMLTSALLLALVTQFIVKLLEFMQRRS